METLDVSWRLIIAGTVLGLVLGATVQRTHFCTMGALSDFWLFGSRRRLKSWALAIAVAILGTQVLVSFGVLDFAGTSWRSPALPWLPLAVGGLMFGFGMVLAGGCVSRNLVRLGAGSLKALVVVLVTAASALATLVGVLAPLHGLLLGIGTFDLGSVGLAGQGTGDLLATAAPLASDTAASAAAGVAGAALLVWCLADRSFRASRRDIVAGLVLGTLVPLGWLATGWLAHDPFEPPPLASLTFVGPTARTFQVVALGSTSAPFGPALVAGTVLGAAVAALLGRSFRLEAFASAVDLGRHLVGAALMGAGGVMAMGCSIGQGISGVSTLALGSLLAAGAIVAGAFWALRWLETGSLVPFAFRPPERAHDTATAEIGELGPASGR